MGLVLQACCHSEGSGSLFPSSVQSFLAVTHAAADLSSFSIQKPGLLSATGIKTSFESQLFECGPPGVEVGVGVDVGVNVEVEVGVDVAVGVRVGVCVTVAVNVAVGVGVGVVGISTTAAKSASQT